MIARDLRERCSNHFTYGDLIECGETLHRYRREGLALDNVPQNDRTWEALTAMATAILDPVHERFGAVVITYGFAGSTLTRHIAGKIAPSLDQHAGMEVNRRGTSICARGGQSCDFHVPGVSSIEVARWVHENLPFDRLYLYGPDRPFHVSYAPERSEKVYAMLRHTSRVVPKEIRPPAWDTVTDLFNAPP